MAGNDRFPKSLGKRGRFGMLTQKELSASIEAYENEIQDAIRAAKEVALPDPVSLSFTTSQLTTAAIEELASSLPTGHKKEDKEAEFIYIFTLSENNDVPITDILSAFGSARDWQDSDEYDGKKNLCRPNEICEPVRALYVGRSYKPRDRMKQHLSASIAGTYAIHFSTWASELEIQIDFYLYRFSGLGNRVVQVLEDGLWDNLKPIFGRRGEK